MKFKNRMKRAATGLLALAMAVTTLLGSTGLTAYAADTEHNPQPPANGERIFSVDPFDSDHSAGYFCVKDTVGNGDVAYNDGEDGEWSGWRGTNGSKSNKIYFDHHKIITMVPALTAPILISANMSGRKTASITRSETTAASQPAVPRTAVSSANSTSMNPAPWIPATLSRWNGKASCV